MKTPTFEENLRKMLREYEDVEGQLIGESTIDDITKNLMQLINQNYVSKEAVVEAIGVEENEGKAETEEAHWYIAGRNQIKEHLKHKLLGKETKERDR